MATEPSRVQTIPEGYSTVTSWIVTRNTAKLLDFMKQAFGAEELSRVYNEDGTIGHAEAKIGDAIVMAFDAKEEWPDTPCFLRLFVPDGDAVLPASTRCRSDLGHRDHEHVLGRPRWSCM